MFSCSNALMMATLNRIACSNQSRNRIENRVKSISKFNFKWITLFIVLISNIHLVKTSEVNQTKINDDIPGRLKIVEAIAGRSFFSDVYQNGTFRTGNSLWDNILNKCTVHPTVSCLQNNVYSYLDDKLEFAGDINVSDGVAFKKNNVDLRKYSKEANIIYLTGSKDEDKSLDEENEIDDDEESGKHYNTCLTQVALV